MKLGYLTERLAHELQSSSRTHAPGGRGYTVTSPLLPELITEGDSVCDALENAKDAFAAIIELCEDIGRPLPATRC